MATQKKDRKKSNKQARELIKKLRQQHKKGKARKKRKKSSVRHTRAIQRDRSKRQLSPPPDEKMTARLSELIKPTDSEEQKWFARFNLRIRKLTLSVMVALVISLIWRQIGAGGSEAARLLQLEGLLWVPTMMVSQQAISERLRTFPATIFFNCWSAVCRCSNNAVSAGSVLCRQRWSGRNSGIRPFWRLTDLPLTPCCARWGC